MNPIYEVGPRPCWHCRWFDGMVMPYTYCGLAGGSALVSAPQMGCCHWEREPGSDDVPDWVPPQSVVYPVTIPARKPARR